MQQLRGHVEIGLRADSAGVTQIGREQGQKALDVLSLSIPGKQPVGCERMPLISISK